MKINVALSFKKIIAFIILQCLDLYKICAWIFPLLIPLEEKNEIMS